MKQALLSATRSLLIILITAFLPTQLLAQNRSAQKTASSNSGNGAQKWSEALNSIDNTGMFGTNNNQPIRFYANNTEFMLLSPTGQLGVNTATPQYRLDVVGNFHLTGSAHLDSDLTVSKRLYLSSLAYPALLTTGNGGIVNALPFNGDTTMVLTGNGNFISFYNLEPWKRVGGNLYYNVGNIGIGNNNPTAMLSVGSANQFQVNSSGNLVDINNVAYSWPATEGVAGSELVNDGQGNLSWMLSDSINPWQKTGNNITYMNGNVGIGVQNPQFPLQVGGDAVINGSVVAQNLYAEHTISIGPFRFVDGALLTGKDSIATSADLNIAATNMRFSADTIAMTGVAAATSVNAASDIKAGGINGIQINGLASMITSPSGHISFGTTSVNTAGIVTASGVKVTGNTVNMPGIVTDTTVTHLMQIDKNGNVTAMSTLPSPGIMTTGSNGSIQALPYNGDTTSVLTGNGSFRGISSLQSWKKSGSATLYYNGNVGIGTNAPASAFSVGNSSQFQVNATGNLAKVNGVSYSWPSAIGASGSVLVTDNLGNLKWEQTDSINIWKRADTNITYMNGNVGIGTANPQFKLSVGGDAVVTGNVVAKTLNAQESISIGSFKFVDGALFSGKDSIKTPAELNIAANGVNLNADTVYFKNAATADYVNATSLNSASATLTNMSADKVAIGSTASGPERLRVVGNTRFQGNMTTTGQLNAGALNVTSNQVRMPGIVTDTTTHLMQVDRYGNVTPVNPSAIAALAYSHQYYPDPCSSSSTATTLWSELDGGASSTGPNAFTNPHVHHPILYTQSGCTFVGIDMPAATAPSVPLEVWGTTSIHGNLQVSNTGGLSPADPSNPLRVYGSLSIYDGNGNTSLFFGQESVTTHQYGKWGVQYSKPNNGNPGGLNFWTPSVTGNIFGNDHLFLADNGNVGINNGNPNSQLDIGVPTNSQSKALAITDQTGTDQFLVYSDGYCMAREFKAMLGTFVHPDYVFADNYKLMPLNNVKAYLKKYKHLPDIPSSKEIKENGGIDIGKMEEKDLKKTEELYLYVIQMNDEIKKLEEENKSLQSQISNIKNKGARK